jgi:hypothetical protein
MLADRSATYRERGVAQSLKARRRAPKILFFACVSMRDEMLHQPNFSNCGCVHSAGNTKRDPFGFFEGKVWSRNQSLLRRGLFVGWHRFASGFVQAPGADFPFSQSALALMAVKFANGTVFRDRLDNLVSEPLPDATKRLVAFQLLFGHAGEPSIQIKASHGAPTGPCRLEGNRADGCPLPRTCPHGGVES